MSPLSRLAVALALLATFSWTLLPAAESTEPPGDPEAEAWMTASRDAFANARWSDALAPTLALVERFPTQQVYSDRLARIYFGLGRAADEAAAWEQFVKVSSTPEDACPSMGQAYDRAGDRARALDAFKRCRDFDPMSAEGAYFLGQAYQRAGRHDDALATFRDAVRVDPVHSDSRIGLAGALLRRGDATGALAVIEPSVSRVPGNPDVHLMQGLALQRLGRRADARAALERAAALTSTYADVHVALGILDYGEGRIASARARFDHALSLAPFRTPELLVWLDRTAEAGR